MGSDTFLLLLGGLVVLAFLAEQAFERLRLPPVLVLIACGLLLGPVTRALPVERFTEVAPHFGALALLLILFEGGLDLELGDVVHRVRAGLVVGVVGFLVGAAVTAAAGAAWGLAPEQAVVLGVILAPVSGAIVLPLVGRMALRQELRTLLVIEAAIADVLAVLAMGVVETLLLGGGLAGLLALGSLLAALFAVVLAVGAGLVWPRVLRRLGDRRYVDVLTVGVALALWGLVELPGASGALTVLVFAMVLANEGALLSLVGVAVEPVAGVTRDAVERLHHFIAQLTFLVRAFFFVFLGVVVSFASLPWSWYLLGAGLVGVLVLSRHLLFDAVEGRGLCALSPRERATVRLLQPRGLVSAVLAVEAAEAGLDAGGLFVGVASLVILVTNLLLMLAARRAAAEQANVTA
jgi:cell volume regulation protein A